MMILPLKMMILPLTMMILPLTVMILPLTMLLFCNSGGCGADAQGQIIMANAAVIVSLDVG